MSTLRAAGAHVGARQQRVQVRGVRPDADPDQGPLARIIDAGPVDALELDSTAPLVHSRGHASAEIIGCERTAFGSDIGSTRVPMRTAPEPIDNRRYCSVLSCPKWRVAAAQGPTSAAL